MNTQSANEPSKNGAVPDLEQPSRKRPLDDVTAQGLEPPSKRRPSDVPGQGAEPPSKRPLSDDDTVQRPSSSEVEDSGKVSGEVFYVGDLHTYYRNGNKCTEFPVILINHADCHRLRVFDENFHATFSSDCNNKWVEIDDVKLKNGCIFVSSKSSIEEIPDNTCTVQPSEHVKLKAERMKEEYEPSGFTKIGSIKGANVRINVKAKIVKVMQGSDPLNEVAMDEPPSLIGFIENVGEIHYYPACPQCHRRRLGRNVDCKWCGFPGGIKPGYVGIICPLSVKVGEKYRDVKLFTWEVRKLLWKMYPFPPNINYHEDIMRSHNVKANIKLHWPVELTSKGEDALKIIECM